MACVAYGCKSHSSRRDEEHRGLTFHRFPRDENVKRLWEEAIHRSNWKPSEYSRLCSRHFSTGCYLESKKKRVLRRDAVPTVFEKYPSYIQARAAVKMEEGLVEINPELFMTCRLCVENKGKFQIVPKLQEKIRFVFDIDITLFDGFSQIMCEKCKAVVIEFSNIKESFQEKQKALRSGAISVGSTANITLTHADEPKGLHVTAQPVNPEPRENGNPDSPVPRNTSYKRISTYKKKKKGKKAKKRAHLTIHSSTSDDEASLPYPIAENSEDGIVDIESILPDSQTWKDFYSRTYVCRYCDTKLTYRKSIRDHVQTHHKLIKKRQKHTRWHSIVRLERFDDRPNLTGEDSVVVINQRKLCQNAESADYFTMFTANGVRSISPSNDHTLNTANRSEHTDTDGDKGSNRKRFTCVDVFSDNEDLHRPKLRKRIRLQSSDSAGTVDLQVDDPLSESESNIDQSSSEAFEPPRNVSATEPEIMPTAKSKDQDIEYNMIKKIVSVSLENIRKKSAKSNAPKINVRLLPDDELVKRKLLSIGRKTMGKRGFVSMGLLKVLEQRNIRIEWVKDKNSKDSMVRILTKLTQSCSDNLNGFQLCEDTGDILQETQLELAQHTEPSQPPAKVLKKKPAFKAKTRTPAPLAPLVVIPLIPSLSSPAAPTSALLPALPHTTLVRNSPTAPTPLLLNILNASPVANPKMAPKKKVSLLKTENKVSQNDHDYDGDLINLDSDDEDTANKLKSDHCMPSLSPVSLNQNDAVSSSTSADTPYPGFTLNVNSSTLGLPIITATASLANNMEAPISETSDDKSVSENTVPRIKCKPVSELMGSRAQSVALGINKNIENKFMDAKSANGDQRTASANDKEPAKLPVSISPGHVVLHTITLPNTVTNSPFDYFSRLLRMHTLYLYDNSARTTLKFASLVKFKLGVHQHPLSVMLCLTLEAVGSCFRISVHNNTNNLVDVSSMAALWQWEVLKAFNSESVIAKIKQAANKDASVTVKTVCLFISLLSSIKLLGSAPPSDKDRSGGIG